MTMQRDLSLLPVAPDALDTVLGLANAMNSMMSKAGPGAVNARRIAAVAEMVTRYQALVLALAPAAVMYRPDMGEAELRAWAADMMGALPS